jgi:hypothetical protein
MVVTHVQHLLSGAPTVETTMRHRILVGVLLVTTAVGLEHARLTFADEADQAGHASMSTTSNADEAAFLADNDQAMTTMMKGMTIKPSGDVDRDFGLLMIPHHEGAIQMARAELRYGKNEQLRRLAQEIVVDQLQEIDVMRLAIGEAPRPPAAAPTQPDATHDHHGTPGGTMNMAPGKN